MNGRRRSYGGVFNFAAVLCGFLVAVGLFVLVFRWYGSGYEELELPFTYYLLVRDCEQSTAAAVTGQTYGAGGAGYLLEREGESMVVLSCYFKEADALRVQEGLTLRGVETRVFPLIPASLTLSGEERKEKEKLLKKACELDGAARVLYETANGLERATLSQREAREAVGFVIGALSGLKEEGEVYGRWNAAVLRLLRRARELEESLLFAKDLRYFEVELCLLTADFANYF